MFWKCVEMLKIMHTHPYIYIIAFNIFPYILLSKYILNHDKLHTDT